jgi:hypothetical protein
VLSSYINPSQSAYHEFINVYVEESDVKAPILPTMEKAMLRSPENSLAVISDFFAAYAPPLDDGMFRRLLTPVLNSAKSSNPLVRAASIGVFKNIVPSSGLSETMGKHTVTEIFALPKSGKTTGPDHRVVLYSMLGALAPSQSVSQEVASVAPGLILKETHEPAITVLAPAVVPHLVFLVSQKLPIPIEVLTKEMNNTKPVLRKAFCYVVGETFWQLNDGVTEALAKPLLPALDNALKAISANPLGTVAGPLEGYVAVALLLGPFLRSNIQSMSPHLVIRLGLTDCQHRISLAMLL